MNEDVIEGGQAVFTIAVAWLESRGWKRAVNKTLLWQKNGEGPWIGFGEALQLQMRFDGIDFAFDTD
jgi:hypothetical protein